jgi:hypothetical protein
MRAVCRLGGRRAAIASVLVLACGNPLGVSVVNVDVGGTVVVSPMEQAGFLVTAVNNGDDRVIWGSGSSSCQLGLVVLDSDGRRHDIDFRDCTSDLVEHGLDPGESRTETFIWGGTILVDQEFLTLSSGQYRLIGLAGDRESDPLPVTVLLP